MHRISLSRLDEDVQVSKPDAMSPAEVITSFQESYQRRVLLRLKAEMKKSLMITDSEGRLDKAHGSLLKQGKELSEKWRLEEARKNTLTNANEEREAGLKKEKAEKQRDAMRKLKLLLAKRKPNIDGGDQLNDANGPNDKAKPKMAGHGQLNPKGADVLAGTNMARGWHLNSNVAVKQLIKSPEPGRMFSGLKTKR
jgi:hypothetical protein